MYDVAVVGLGAFGAHSLWQLATRGLSVVGLDQFPTLHPFGSSHGHTRLFRGACMEHIELGRVAKRSAELWRELEAEIGTSILDQQGALTIGKPDSDYVKGAIATAHKHEIPVEIFTAEELAQRYPAFENVLPEEIGVLDTSGGTVAAEGSISAALTSAQRLGADVLSGGRVTAAEKQSDAITLTLSTGESVKARKIVLAVGPWLARLVDMDGLQALRSAMNWWKIDTVHGNRPPEAYAAPNLAGFIRRFEEMSIWGHGDVDGRGMKIGLSLNSREHFPIDPSNFERDIVPARDWVRVAEIAARAFPAINPIPAASRTCMITTSPDDQFIIGPVGSDGDVVVAGACHGHGFKHAAAIGEYVAQTVVGEDPTVEPGIWSPGRFARFEEQLLTSFFERKEF